MLRLCSLCREWRDFWVLLLWLALISHREISAPQAVPKLMFDAERWMWILLCSRELMKAMSPQCSRNCSAFL